MKVLIGELVVDVVLSELLFAPASPLLLQLSCKNLLLTRMEV